MWRVTFNTGEARTYGDAVTSQVEAYAQARNIADMYGWRIIGIERKA